LRYEANGYSLYEVDVNKKMRHTKNEFDGIDVPPNDEPQEIGIPTIGEPEDSAKSTTVNIGKPITPLKSKGEKEAGPFSKFWNWMTQLF
jgi:hypothetical protein